MLSVETALEIVRVDIDEGYSAGISFYTGAAGFVFLVGISLAVADRVDLSACAHVLPRVHVYTCPRVPRPSIHAVRPLPPPNLVSTRPYAIGSVLYHIAGRGAERDALVASLLGLEEEATECDEDELLYGRAGYLYALLFVRTHVPLALLPPEMSPLIDRVAVSILQRGIAFAGGSKFKVCVCVCVCWGWGVEGLTAGCL